MARRSGSEKRQRTSIVTMRINPQEAAAIRRIAQKRGESVSSIMRNALLRSRSRASRLDLAAVAQVRTGLGTLTGAVNKIGSLMNQFVRGVNRGRNPEVDAMAAQWEEFKTMFDRDMAELRIVCLQALGKEPRRSTSANDED